MLNRSLKGNILLKNNRLVIREINKNKCWRKRMNEWASKPSQLYRMCGLDVFPSSLVTLWMNDDDFRFSVFFHFKYFPFGSSYVVLYSFHFYRWFLWLFFFSSSFRHIELAIVYFNNFSSFCFSFLWMDLIRLSVVRDFVNDSMYSFIYLNSKIQFSFLFASTGSINKSMLFKSWFRNKYFDGIDLLILNGTESSNDYYLSIL